MSASHPSASQPAPKVELDRLVKRFGPITAVDRVSFSVGSGEVLGFLGPNGAGKSTTMKMLTCFLAPTSGTARVCGHDILSEPRAVRAHIGYLPEGAPAYPDMTPLGFLKFVADIRGLRGDARSKAVDRAIEATSLEGVLHQPIETLSKGFKRRVGLAQAILHDPPVLILDEPTDGLDPNQKHEVRSLIRSMAKDKVIILSTHILEEVEAVCTRAIIIARGTVVVDETPAALQARAEGHNAVTIAVEGPAAKDAAPTEKALAALPKASRVERLTQDGASALTFRVYPRRGEAILTDVTNLAREKGWTVRSLRSDEGRLDDVFRELTLGEKAAANSASSKKRKAPKSTPAATAETNLAEAETAEISATELEEKATSKEAAERE